MLKRLVLALAVVSAPISAAQQEPRDTNPDPHRPDRAQVTLDQDDARRFVDDFARCTASRRPPQAAAALAFPYGSKEQGKALNDLASREIDCWGAFSGSGLFSSDSGALAAGVAEYFVVNPGRIDDARKRAPQAFAGRNAEGIELFGDCVVEQNPAAVEALVKTPVASGAESAAEDALAPHLAACISEGHTLSLDRTALRQLLAVSLYRHIAMPPPQPAPANPQQ